jgi:hypothetical protein
MSGRSKVSRCVHSVTSSLTASGDEVVRTVCEASLASVYASWDRATRNNPRFFSSWDVPIFGYLSAKRSFIECPPVCMEHLRYYLLCDYINSSCALRPDPCFLYPYIQLMYERGSDEGVYITMRCILQWIHVTRKYGKGILHPDMPGFTLYRHFHRILGLYSLKTLQDTFQHPSSLLDSIRAFLQLDEPHFLHRDGLDACCTYLSKSTTTRGVFPQLVTTLDMMRCRRAGARIPTVDSIPGHCFLYAFLLHSQVPRPLKVRLFQSITLKHPRVPPRHVKGGPPRGTFENTSSGMKMLFHFLEGNRSIPKEWRPFSVSQQCTGRDRLCVNGTRPLENTWVVMSVKQ